MFTQIEARGPDAVSFLQAQLTQDVTQVSATHSPLAAWCDPRGRVIVILRLVRLDDGIGLILPASLAEPVLRELGKYRFRAKVELDAADAAWRALAVAGKDDLERLAAADLLPEAAANASRQRVGVTAVKLSAAADCVEVYGEEAAFGAAGLEFREPLECDAWRVKRIAAGIADLAPETSGRYTPHMLNLDRLGAVNFDKGCYTGQEIVARTQYRGSVKRRLRHYRGDGAPAVGEKLTRDGRAVGDVVSVAGNEFLALLPDDAADAVLDTAGGAARPADTVGAAHALMPPGTPGADSGSLDRS